MSGVGGPALREELRDSLELVKDQLGTMTSRLVAKVADEVRADGDRALAIWLDSVARGKREAEAQQRAEAQGWRRCEGSSNCRTYPRAHGEDGRWVCSKCRSAERYATYLAQRQSETS
jgi:hypothetical protein